MKKKQRQANPPPRQSRGLEDIIEFEPRTSRRVKREREESEEPPTEPALQQRQPIQQAESEIVPTWATQLIQTQQEMAKQLAQIVPQVAQLNRQVAQLVPQVAQLAGQVAQVQEARAHDALLSYARAVWGLEIPPIAKPGRRIFHESTEITAFDEKEKKFLKNSQKGHPGLGLKTAIGGIEFDSLGFGLISEPDASFKPIVSPVAEAQSPSHKTIAQTASAHFSAQLFKISPNAVLVAESTTARVSFDNAYYPFENAEGHEKMRSLLSKLYQLEIRVRFVMHYFGISERQVFAALHLPNHEKEDGLLALAMTSKYGTLFPTLVGMFEDNRLAIIR